ncbi:368R [Invertebrate iridescent virus Kaz2018]|uniref:Uncharacterized protein 368R n=1 Tax=Invertebrate iridescent virus 6 TaxID=176652 RepID=368R_IIV6|nr:368R [Invertebrate iridescent virus 6]Q91FF6.1 RecName: Full=Uncharacterized protein 368R; Flags: Precursor [Invertebrate iridescent virus 6]AAK82228.1 368R [Invertebrate iridescent virus 6]QMS79613.1 hypothetical protein IIV6-T1_361 [Invertebrate iridescent virus 6]QNH08778.1 368R [Invertebrate iridescent virus Kaz2018]
MSIPNLSSVTQLLSIATGLVSTNNPVVVPVVTQILSVVSQLLSGTPASVVLPILQGLIPLLTNFPLILIQLLSVIAGLQGLPVPSSFSPDYKV